MTRQFAILDLEKEALTVSENLLPVVFSLLGKHGDAVVTAEARLAGDPIYLTARRHLGLALAAAGDYDRARPILEEMWQRSGGRVTRRGPFQTPTAAALIAIRRDAGEEESDQRTRGSDQRECAPVSRGWDHRYVAGWLRNLPVLKR